MSFDRLGWCCWAGGNPGRQHPQTGETTHAGAGLVARRGIWMTSSQGRNLRRRAALTPSTARSDGRPVTTIVVTGTGVCSTVAFGYYAPLGHLVPGSKLHILEWWGLASVQRSVDRLVRRLHRASTPVNLIGHSQGGLVAAALRAKRCRISLTG